MRVFDEYRGLRKEIYVLFFGRIVTNMGAMIWPVLTLILNQKLGLNAEQTSLFLIATGLIELPASIIGGKLADRYSKKMIIVWCDIAAVILFVITSFLPLSFFSLTIAVFASAFQTMEWPAYSSLFADLSLTKDRERAYSLSYLGGNLGLVLSPTIAGILFNNYLWLSFLLCGVAVACSTVLIFFLVKDITPLTNVDEDATYQKGHEDESLITVLKANAPIILFLFVDAVYEAAYHQWGYLIPLELGRVHGDMGSVLYGSITNTNCIVVVLFTPLFTRLFAKLVHTRKILLGQMLVMAGYVVFKSLLGFMPSYYMAITVFTFGEILTTISFGPYLTARIPASHRGRMDSFRTVIAYILQGCAMWLSGRLFDTAGSTAAWMFVAALLVVCCAGSVAVIFMDRKKYPDLYAKS